MVVTIWVRYDNRCNMRFEDSFVSNSNIFVHKKTDVGIVNLR